MIYSFGVVSDANRWIGMNIPGNLQASAVRCPLLCIARMLGRYGLLPSLNTTAKAIVKFTGW